MLKIKKIENKTMLKIKKIKNKTMLKIKKKLKIKRC